MIDLKSIAFLALILLISASLFLELAAVAVRKISLFSTICKIIICQACP